MRESTISGDLESSRNGGGIRKMKKPIESNMDSKHKLDHKTSFLDKFCGCGKQNINTAERKYKKEPQKITTKKKLKRRDSC